MFLIFSFFLFAASSFGTDVLTPSTPDTVIPKPVEPRKECAAVPFSDKTDSMTQPGSAKECPNVYCPPVINNSRAEPEIEAEPTTVSAVAWISPVRTNCKGESETNEQHCSPHTSAARKRLAKEYAFILKLTAQSETEEESAPLYPMENSEDPIEKKIHVPALPIEISNTSNLSERSKRDDDFNEQLFVNIKEKKEKHELVFTPDVRDLEKEYKMLETAIQIQQSSASKEVKRSLDKVKEYIPQLVESYETPTGHLWEIDVNGVSVFIYTLTHHGNQIEDQIRAINTYYLDLLQAFIVDRPKVTSVPKVEDMAESEMAKHAMQAEIKKQAKETEREEEVERLAIEKEKKENLEKRMAELAMLQAETKSKAEAKRKEEEAAQAERERQIEKLRKVAITEFINQETQTRKELQSVETTARKELNAQEQEQREREREREEEKRQAAIIAEAEAQAKREAAEKIKKFYRQIIQKRAEAATRIEMAQRQAETKRKTEEAAQAERKRQIEKSINSFIKQEIEEREKVQKAETTAKNELNAQKQSKKHREIPPDRAPEGKADKHDHKSMDLEELLMHFANRYLHANPDPLANGNSIDPSESDDDDKKAYLPWALGPLYPQHPQADNTDSGRNKTKWSYTVPAHNPLTALPYPPALKLLGSSCGWVSPWMAFYNYNHQFLLKQLYNDRYLRQLFDQRAMVQILKIPNDWSASNTFSDSMKIHPVFASQSPTKTPVDYAPDFLTQNCWEGEARPSSAATARSKIHGWKAQQVSRGKPYFNSRLAVCFPLLAAAYMLSPSTDHQAK